MVFASLQRALPAAALFTLVALASTTHAATTIYTTQAAFEAALATPSYLETFTGGSGVASSYTFSGSGYGYRVSSPGGNVYRDGTFIGAATGANGVLFTATAGNYTAIGGNFYLTNINTAFVAGSVTLTTNDGTTTTFSPTSPTAGSFRGFISTAPITTLTMGTSAAGTYNSIDNVRVGVAPVASVTAPEPASVALLLPALPIAGILLRRFKKH